MIKKIIKYIIIIYYKITNNKSMLNKEYISQCKKKGMKIGENCRCFSNINDSEPYLIEIGNNVTISTNVNFITHDNSITKICDEYTDCFGKISIGDNCFIGLGAIIMPGVTIADNIIIAAGSVVTKSFKDNNIIIGGNPAKKISNIDRDKLYTKEYYHNTRKMSYEEKKMYLMQLEDRKLKTIKNID